MDTKRSRLVSIFILMFIFLSCSMRRNIVGKYYHKELGLNYTLELRSNYTFIQKIIKGEDTCVNMGRYSLSLNSVRPSPWKNKNELLNTPIDKGGCFGCELKYKRGMLYYYTNPDGLPEDIFIKIGM